MESNKPLIYIASPYTKGLKSKNARYNIEMWTYFTEHCPRYDFYPALWPAHVMHMGTDLGRGDFPDVDEQYWLNYDLNMLDKCHGIILVNGWDGAKWTESSGCNGEFEHAQEMDIKMFCQASEPECKFIAGVVKALNVEAQLYVLSSKEAAEKFSKERLEPDMGYRGTPILSPIISMLNDVKIVDVSQPQKVHVVDLGSYHGLNIEIFSSEEKAREYAESQEVPHLDTPVVEYLVDVVKPKPPPKVWEKKLIYPHSDVSFDKFMDLIREAYDKLGLKPQYPTDFKNFKDSYVLLFRNRIVGTTQDGIHFGFYNENVFRFKAELVKK